MKLTHFAFPLALATVAACSSEPAAESDAADATGDDAAISAPAGDGSIADSNPEPDAASPAARRSVMYGGDSDFDACAQAASVGNLDPEGDNFLSVRAAPSVGASELNRLSSGQSVSICESESGWSGIVYSDTPGDSDCGTGTPVADRQDYSGPCKSGWVSNAFLVDIAG